MKPYGRTKATRICQCCHDRSNQKCSRARTTQEICDEINEYWQKAARRPGKTLQQIDALLEAAGVDLDDIGPLDPPDLLVTDTERLAEIDLLWDAEPGTPEGDRLDQLASEQDAAEDLWWAGLERYPVTTTVLPDEDFDALVEMLDTPKNNDRLADLSKRSEELLHDRIHPTSGRRIGKTSTLREKYDEARRAGKNVVWVSREELEEIYPDHPEECFCAGCLE